MKSSSFFNNDGRDYPLGWRSACECIVPVIRLRREKSLMKKFTDESIILTTFVFLLSLTVTLAWSPAADGQVFINEIFADPGGGGEDDRDAYIELRGTPDLSLEDHYLIFIENEDNPFGTGLAGTIENIFTFGDDPDTPAVETPLALGSNGFLTLRQNGNLYSAPVAGTTDLVNTSGDGWGSTAGGTSTVRHKDLGNQGELEGSGFTALLIRDTTGTTPPTLGFDLDVGNDGLDVPTGRAGWEIVDGIGYYGEPGEALLGRVYAQVNFGPEIVGELIDIGLPDLVPFESPNIEPGAVYVGMGYEIEYVGRFGDSTGQTPDDWHATNLTDNTVSGSTGVPDFRVSGGLTDPTEDDGRVETNQGIPFGTKIVDTLGATNLFEQDGDFNDDGDVDGADFLIWQRNFGFGTGLIPDSPTTALREHGDTNGDWTVDGLDLDDWELNYGIGSSPLQTVASVPEPTSAVLAVGMCLMFATRAGGKRFA